MPEGLIAGTRSSPVAAVRRYPRPGARAGGGSRRPCPPGRGGRSRTARCRRSASACPAGGSTPRRSRDRRPVASPAEAASLTENGSQAGFLNELMPDAVGTDEWPWRAPPGDRTDGGGQPVLARRSAGGRGVNERRGQAGERPQRRQELLGVGVRHQVVGVGHPQEQLGRLCPGSSPWCARRVPGRVRNRATGPASPPGRSGTR